MLGAGGLCKGMQAGLPTPPRAGLEHSSEEEQLRELRRGSELGSCSREPGGCRGAGWVPGVSWEML